eukprot:scaffold309646_cov17-Tisochrysis_lutea.AAC.1
MHWLASSQHIKVSAAHQTFNHRAGQDSLKLEWKPMCGSLCVPAYAEDTARAATLTPVLPLVTPFSGKPPKPQACRVSSASCEEEREREKTVQPRLAACNKDSFTS